jgi:hypothetical protein
MDKNNNELDLSFNIDLGDFSDIEINIDIDTNQRYCKPAMSRSKNVKYKNAKELSKAIEIKQNERYFCIIDGSFIFGDFIEAFLTERNMKVKELTISTLSMSQENIESFRNLITWGYLEKLNIIVSDFFYSHERNNLVKYMYERLDIDDKFQLSVCRTHTKICLIENYRDEKFIIHGSANLRSSDNIEQFMIEENKELYDFNFEFHKKIINNFATIKKSLRGDKLFNLIQ